MFSFTRIIYLGLFTLYLTYSSRTNAQHYNFLEPNQDNILKWCTVGIAEYKKCTAFANAVKEDQREFQQGYDDWYLDVKCVNGTSKGDCMGVLEEEKADVTSLDAGEVFSAGRYYSLVPILQEMYSGILKNYYAVAVIKKGTLLDVSNLRHLRNKKACFAGVGTLAGWIIPLGQLINRGGLEIVDCNNLVKNAVTFFGPSCAVNSLLDKYNPIGDNSDKLCKLCIGKVPGQKCTNADPYAGMTGAFRCLLEAGEIAFLKHTSVAELATDSVNFPTIKKEDFELLCLDGSRTSIDNYEKCKWGTVPSHAIVTSSAKTSKIRRKYQQFLQKAFELYGRTSNNKLSNETVNGENNRDTSWRGRDQYGREDDYYSRDNNRYNGNNNNEYGSVSSTTDYPSATPADHEYRTFHLFESVPRYGNEHDLLFLDVAEQLYNIPEKQQTFEHYLGRKSLEDIAEVRKCPVRAMTLCVTSDPEMEKCFKMKIALKAQLLQPDLICYKGHSHINCMQAIRNGNADVAVLDAGDVYTGGLHYSLVPIMSEIYNLGVPEYYAVAIAKEEDPSTEITYLKGKNTCHGGINTGAGWVVPMAFLISNGWVRSYGCDAMKAAAECFSKMCLPGSQSTEYNTGVPYDNMCQLCHGPSYRYCHRDASEDYYGHTGAFRCLVEGGGDVAFVKHTTVTENTDGKRKEWWARNTLKEDFQLLCPDGTRSSLDNFRECNLGRVKANAILARGGDAYNLTEINAFINLFVYAQQFYGRKDQDYFNYAMFYSTPPFSDLIFQDATTQLSIVPPELRWYSDYLGKDFLRAKRIVDCYASASQAVTSLVLVLFSVIISGKIFS